MKWRIMYQPKSYEMDKFVTEDETESIPHVLHINKMN